MQRSFSVGTYIHTYIHLAAELLVVQVEAEAARSEAEEGGGAEVEERG